MRDSIKSVNIKDTTFTFHTEGGYLVAYDNTKKRKINIVRGDKYIFFGLLLLGFREELTKQALHLEKEGFLIKPKSEYLKDINNRMVRYF